jgi:hypothetical protein
MAMQLGHVHIKTREDPRKVAQFYIDIRRDCEAEIPGRGCQLDLHGAQLNGRALSRQRERACIESQTRQASCRCDSTLPLCGSLGSEDPQCGSGDEVALQIEGIVAGGMHAQETLGGSS